MQNRMWDCYWCGEDIIWLGDGFDCPFTDMCEGCWDKYET
jgi:hypothetical protein